LQPILNLLGAFSSLQPPTRIEVLRKDPNGLLYISPSTPSLDTITANDAFVKEHHCTITSSQPRLLSSTAKSPSTMPHRTYSPPGDDPMLEPIAICGMGESR
jgi:hypothetical protein